MLPRNNVSVHDRERTWDSTWPWPVKVNPRILSAFPSGQPAPPRPIRLPADSRPCHSDGNMIDLEPAGDRTVAPVSRAHAARPPRQDSQCRRTRPLGSGLTQARTPLSASLRFLAITSIPEHCPKREATRRGFPSRPSPGSARQGRPGERRGKEAQRNSDPT